ncbi:MAG: M48 family metallopeptidase, partial [bacterium]|nr:M48 family metallopeptidase [bacterium]
AKGWAAARGRPVGRISVRDPRGQWGSGSRSGNLSFSWRLVLAPIRVLDYVAAHEATHLAEFGHGHAFRRTLAELCPDVKPAEAWLAKQGHELHRYG